MDKKHHMIKMRREGQPSLFQLISYSRQEICQVILNFGWLRGFIFLVHVHQLKEKKWRFCHGAVAHEQSKHLIYGLTYNSYLLPKFIGFSMLYYIGNNLESKNFQI